MRALVVGETHSGLLRVVAAFRAAGLVTDVVAGQTPPPSLAHVGLVVVDSGASALQAWLDAAKGAGVFAVVWGNETPPPEVAANEFWTEHDHLPSRVASVVRASRVWREAQHWASFPEQNPNPLFEVDSRGAVIFANAAARQMLANPGAIDTTQFIDAFGQPPQRRTVTSGELAWDVELRWAPQWRCVRVYARECSRERAAEASLEQAANELESRVAERTAELEQTLAELHLQFELSREAELAAIDASHAKSVFLANMSHELRTPLNAIIGYTELLLEEIDDEAAISDLRKVHASAKHLLAVIRDILDLSKIEAGHMEVLRETVDAETLGAEVATTAEGLVSANRNRFVMKVLGRIPPLHADRDKLRQVLLNLVGNATKFTEDGEIQLVLRTVPGFVAFEVIDSGIGIDPTRVPSLFEPFTQADATTTRKYGGTGLGLAISQRFVHLMSGRIEVDTRPGHGSTFRVLIPTLSGHEVPVMEGAATVLVIDDDPDAQQLVARMLAPAYAARSALDGRRGLELALSLRPALIILDIVLPDIEGWQVLTTLRSNPQTAMIPVIILSMISDPGRGYEAGCSGYLVKPAERQSLIGLVSAYVAQG